jgi:hypothetical protein
MSRSGLVGAGSGFFGADRNGKAIRSNPMSSQERKNDGPELIDEVDLSSVEKIFWALGEIWSDPPREVFESADAKRSDLTPLLLEALEEGLRNPLGCSPEQSTQFCHALYLLAKWRESRALPAVLRWLSLPGENAFDLTGDVATNDGGRILAAVCGGDLSGIKVLAENESVHPSLQGQGMVALEALVAWGELTLEALKDYLLELVDTRLPQGPAEGWTGVAITSAELGIEEVFPAVRNAFTRGWVDNGLFDGELYEEMLTQAKTGELGTLMERCPRIEDVAEETEWWACYEKPVISTPKIGRNEQCPCGSGKKYKKCCGKN